MTATFGITERSIFGNKRIVWAYADITGYASGGVPVTAANVGLKKITAVKVISQEKGDYIITPICSSTGLYTSSGTATTSVTGFLLYSSTGTAETISTGNKNLGAVKLEVIGT